MFCEKMWKNHRLEDLYYVVECVILSNLLNISPFVFSDPGTASLAGSLALMGQDGALSGHEVLGGEVVQLLRKPFKHLLLRPATSQRCVHES